MTLNIAYHIVWGLVHLGIGEGWYLKIDGDKEIQKISTVADNIVLYIASKIIAFHISKTKFL